jgi:hypothetical protein
MLCSPPSPGPAGGSKTSGSGALPVSPRSRTGNYSVSATSACWLRSAFVAPRIVAAIADGNAPANLTVTGLAKALPYSWAEQQKGFPESTTCMLIA